MLSDAAIETMMDKIVSSQVGSTEDLSTYDAYLDTKEKFLVEYQAMHGDEPVEVREEKKKTDPMLTSSTGEFTWIIDTETLIQICYNDMAFKSGLYKLLSTMPAGSTINIHSAIANVPVRAHFLLTDIHAILNLLKLHGHKLNFVWDNDKSYIDLSLMVYADTFSIEDFAFLTLGHGLDTTKSDDALKDVTSAFIEGIFSFLSENHLLSEEERQGLDDNPDEKYVFLTADQLRERRRA